MHGEQKIVAAGYHADGYHPAQPADFFALGKVSHPFELDADVDDLMPFHGFGVHESGNLENPVALQTPHPGFHRVLGYPELGGDFPVGLPAVLELADDAHVEPVQLYHGACYY